MSKTEEKNIEALKAELEIQKAQLKKLQDQLNPPPREPSTHRRYDPTEGMSADRATMLRMAAVDTSGLQADLRAYQQQRSVTSSPAEPQRPRGSGWVEERKIEPSPGIELMDRMMDEQDRRDKVELAMRLAQTEAATEQAKKDSE